MSMIVAFNVIAAVALMTAVIWLLLKSRKGKLDLWVLIPLMTSLLFYFFITFSNALEHGGISSFFDPFEDIAEILFTFTLLFFINNWRSQYSLETIKNKENWLNSAFESLQEGILTTDSEGNILFLNKELEKMTGWSRLEASGHKAEEILIFLDKNTGKPITCNPYRDALTGVQSDKYPQGLFLRHRVQGKMLVVSNVSPIFNSEGKIQGAVGAFRDISDFNSIMEQLNHTHKMEAMGQLAGGVAHDLNNMLGGIMGAADLLKLELADDGVAKYDDLISIITESTLNGRELTSSLLAFGRKGKILSTPLSVSSVIEKTVAMADRTIGREHRIEADAVTENLYIIGDPSQIQNALLNLIINARDAQPGGGVITLEAHSVCMDKVWCRDCDLKLPEGDYVRIRVTDRGAGIAPEMQNKIFEPFFTTKAEGKGTGLGLAAVYRTMISHQGMIKLNSRMGEGSSFELYFPLIRKSDKPEERASEELHTRQSRKMILVVDDETVLRTTISMMLEQCGMSILQAEDGERGWEIFRNQHGSIDAVFLDMVMPGMSGTDVLVKIRSLDSDIPVILTSGFVNHDDLPPLANGFLHKPFRMKELVEVLNKCFDSSLTQNQTD